LVSDTTVTASASCYRPTTPPSGRFLRNGLILRGPATALGWRDEQIVVVDNDQGESGASAAWREGFQRLVSDVGMGRAGIVMGLEVSRLARNNADWQRLLEICAFKFKVLHHSRRDARYVCSYSHCQQ
jgi:hypothetical protein